MWTATGQSVNYANWDDGQPLFNEEEGHAIVLNKATHKMFVDETKYIDTGIRSYSMAHYICEKNAFANGARDSQMKQKSCSAGSDWTCRNEVTGCYCHQTIEVQLILSFR